MARRGATFLRINTAPAPIRLTSIFGKIDLPQDAVETGVAGGTYTGFGLLNIPAVQQLINGLAERVDFQLAGVPREASYLADLEANDVRGAACYLGLVRLDDDWQPIGAVRWLWSGEADAVSTSRTTDTGGGVTRTIALSIGTLNTMRKRAVFDTYSPVSQRSKSPTDAICDLTPRYVQGSTKKWA